jgi:hypothetical protein
MCGGGKTALSIVLEAGSRQFAVGGILADHLNQNGESIKARGRLVGKIYQDFIRGARLRVRPDHHWRISLVKRALKTMRHEGLGMKSPKSLIKKFSQGTIRGIHPNPFPLADPRGNQLTDRLSAILGVVMKFDDGHEALLMPAARLIKN